MLQGKRQKTERMMRHESNINWLIQSTADLTSRLYWPSPSSLLHLSSSPQLKFLLFYPDRSIERGSNAVRKTAGSILCRFSRIIRHRMIYSQVGNWSTLWEAKLRSNKRRNFYSNLQPGPLIPRLLSRWKICRWKDSSKDGTRFRTVIYRRIATEPESGTRVEKY